MPKSDNEDPSSSSTSSSSDSDSGSDDERQPRDVVEEPSEETATDGAVVVSVARPHQRSACQICCKEEWRYRCPRCDVRSCSLGCVVRHKQDTGCSGLRDRTKFVSKAEFTDLDLLSDYRLLEEINRGLEAAAKGNLDDGDKEKTPKQRRFEIPKQAHVLRTVCGRRERNCRLLFLPKGFERRRQNCSRFDHDTATVFWRVRLVFPHCKRTVVVEDVNESTKLFSLLSEYVEVDDRVKSYADVLTEDPFAQYRAAWPSGVSALLKAEHLSNKEVDAMKDESGKQKVARFFELELKKSLRINLKGRTVVEHPVIFVVLKSHSDFFPAEIELPKMLEAQEKKPTLKKDDSSVSEAEYQRNWDWSDYHTSTVKRRRGVPTEFEEEEEDVEEPSGKTFGLFAEEDGDDADWGEESYADRMRRHMDAEEDERRMVKRQRSREDCQKILDLHQKRWRGSRSRHEDASFVHAFAMQGEDSGQSGENHQEGFQQDEATEENYEKYYDFYLKYYQTKYGLNIESSNAPAEVSGETNPLPAAKGLGALVGYGSSDDDQE